MAAVQQWFTHESSKKDSVECSVLIDQLGLEGYGIFWILLETLMQQPDYRYPLAMLPILARKYNTSGEKMKAVVTSYGLFVLLSDNEGSFCSPELNKKMEAYEALIEAKRAAGRAGGEKSAKKRAQQKISSTGQAVLEQCSSSPQAIILDNITLDNTSSASDVKNDVKEEGGGENFNFCKEEEREETRNKAITDTITQSPIPNIGIPEKVAPTQSNRKKWSEFTLPSCGGLQLRQFVTQKFISHLDNPTFWHWFDTMLTTIRERGQIIEEEAVKTWLIALGRNNLIDATECCFYTVQTPTRPDLKPRTLPFLERNPKWTRQNLFQEIAINPPQTVKEEQKNKSVSRETVVKAIEQYCELGIECGDKETIELWVKILGSKEEIERVKDAYKENQKK